MGWFESGDATDSSPWIPGRTPDTQRMGRITIRMRIPAICLLDACGGQDRSRSIRRIRASTELRLSQKALNLLKNKQL
jgi:hypothetical protein